LKTEEITVLSCSLAYPLLLALSAEPIFESNDYYPLGKAAGNGMCKRAFSAPALKAFSH
jgi:hypothetical protein